MAFVFWLVDLFINSFFSFGWGFVRNRCAILQIAEMWRTEHKKKKSMD